MSAFASAIAAGRVVSASYVAVQAVQAREAIAALRADSHAPVPHVARRETRLGPLQPRDTGLASLG
ncbi:hypothetical protein, partial [Gemmatimonas sp.]|uniref:hypothetical protein n=1 Tax=Gemmatimonas sp. TaxID=1962908 RepID=UPI00391EED94